MLYHGRGGPVLLLALLSCVLLGGCTAGAPAPLPARSASASALDALSGAGSGDIGNGRPTVSYDGPLVQRRVVLAVQTAADADASVLRAGLERRAAGARLTLSDTSPDTLPPGVLEQAVPQLTLLLPAGSTEDDARGIIDASGRGAHPSAQYFVLTVLVHDIVFEVASTDPAALADAIALEGILADALGNYDTVLGTDTVKVVYLGTLLGDDVVESVRGAMARPAGTMPMRVAVAAGTPGAEGVDVAAEPEPKPVTLAGGASHDSATHPAAPGAPPGAETATVSPPLGAWLVYWFGLAAVLCVTVALAGWRVFPHRRQPPAYRARTEAARSRVALTEVPPPLNESTSREPPTTWMVSRMIRKPR